MKFIYDISFISEDNLTKGIPVHSLRILRAVPPEDRHNITLLINAGMQQYANNELKGYNFAVYPHFSGIRQKIYNRLLGKYVYRHIVNRGGFDALIVPDEYRHMTIQNFKIPKFIFCHDLKGTKEEYNSSIRKMRMRKRLYHDAIRTSDLVFAISQYTKDDIREIYPDTDMAKVFVVYDSIEIAGSSKKPDGVDSDSSFILSVNHLDSYKNALTTIKAFSMIANDYSGKLVIVSKPTQYWTEECLPFVKQKKIDDRIILLSNISDNELKWLYVNADLFVSSSSHEGFGFTPIEAAICHCPVICTEAEALPETTMGKLNYYSPPEDAEALARKLVSVMKTPPAESRLNEIANEFSEKYSPIQQFQRMKKLISDFFASKQ